jgi:hypothetical protein
MYSNRAEEHYSQPQPAMMSSARNSKVDDSYHYAPAPLPQRNNLRSSPICVPQEAGGGFSDGEDGEDDWNEDPVEEYRSPSIKQKALRHEAEKERRAREQSLSNAQNKPSAARRDAAKAERAPDRRPSGGGEGGREGGTGREGEGGLHYSRQPRKVEYR